MDEHISLYELNFLVRKTLSCALQDFYWVKAEVGEVNPNRGHCFLELVERDERSDKIIAKSRAVIWANRWGLLRKYFEDTTGQPLSVGMQVLVQVQVTFHELYGYSLTIVNIDPKYSLGEIAQRRSKIIRQLEAEGVLTMNKEIELPRLLNRIAIVSSPTAAGYGDFVSQLSGNRRKLAFKTKLFPALMQGDGTERSVIDALNAIAAEMEQWDIVVIIRGGGATSDLSAFDSLALAENVAQFPLPIITGIGHERDDTVIDIVAHTRVKTPTAAAEFLIHHQEIELDTVEDLNDRLQSAALALYNAQCARLSNIVSRIPTLFSLACERERRRLERLSITVSSDVKKRIDGSSSRLKLTAQRLHLTTLSRLDKERHALALKTNKIDYASPARILNMGYSITRLNGHAITHTDKLKAGDTITTEFAHGTSTSVVKEISIPQPIKQ